MKANKLVSVMSDIPRINLDELSDDDLLRERHKEDITVVFGKPFTGVIYFNHPNGKLAHETSYVNGLMNGFRRRWYESGKIKTQFIGITGWEAEIKEWYENGQLKLEEKMRLGLSFGAMNGTTLVRSHLSIESKTTRMQWIS